ncbi:MAG: nucleotide exchange factor GrpE [Candidatus Omnitrophota bacterium]|nr:MAG: nucleotide exchange factor GrpE [Candidatus Omnitrophota bacterium]
MKKKKEEAGSLPKEETPKKERDRADDNSSTSVSLQERLEKKNKEYEMLWDKYIRQCAEFDNARKRWEKERVDVIKFANFTLLKDLVVIVDEMEQALKMIGDHKTSEEISKGLEIMLNNFVTLLTKRGIRSIEAKGKKFDPHFHEIVVSRQVEGDEDDHVVLEEVQRGYLLEDKVLRTAKVVVGVKKQSTVDGQQSTEVERDEEEKEI